MSSTSEPNKPSIHPFWQQILEINPRTVSPRIDKSKKPTKEQFSSLVCKLQYQPVECLAPLAKLYLSQPNMTEPGFRNVAAIFGKLPQEEEIDIIKRLISHRRFTQIAAFELKERGYRMKTPGLAEALKKFDSSVTKQQIATAVKAVEKQYKKMLSPVAGR